MIKGTQYYLRNVLPIDLEILLKWENNQDNWLISGTVAPFSREMLTDYVFSVQDINLTNQLRFMICNLSTDEVLGTIDLYEYDPVNQRAGVGVLIGEASNRRKGIGKESLNLVIEYAKTHLNLHQLHCAILVDNLASKKLFVAAGFQFIGTKKEWIKNNLEWKDEDSYQLLLQH